jgi:hypothetical protein
VDPQVVRYSERPELWASIGDLSAEVWPEYNLHGQTLNYYWDQLYDVFPDWQFVLCDLEDGTVLAEGHTIPVAWDGTDPGLGPGIDATIAAGFGLRAAAGRPTAACALAASPRQAPVRAAAAGDGGPGPRSGTGSPDRTGPSQLQGSLPHHSHRTLRPLDHA